MPLTLKLPNGAQLAILLMKTRFVKNVVKSPLIVLTASKEDVLVVRKMDNTFLQLLNWYKHLTI